MADKRSILPTKGVLAQTTQNAKVPMPNGQKTFNELSGPKSDEI
jgi:hypothetical protein